MPNTDIRFENRGLRYKPVHVTNAYACCEIKEMYIFKFISGKIGFFDNQKIEKEIEIQQNKITERMLKGRSVGGTAGALNRDIDNMGKKLDNLKSRLNLQTALSFYHEP